MQEFSGWYLRGDVGLAVNSWAASAGRRRRLQSTFRLYIGLRWMIGDSYAAPPPEPLVRRY
jgi:hypothetical protein